MWWLTGHCMGRAAARSSGLGGVGAANESWGWDSSAVGSANAREV